MARRLQRQQDASHSSDKEHIRAAETTVHLTRREVLAAGAALALAGCAPAASHAPKATPIPFALKRPATVYADATVPQALAAAVIQRIAGSAGISNAIAAPSLAAFPDLVLSFGAPPSDYEGVAISTSPATVFTHLRVPLDGVSAAQAQGLLGGAITDWSAVGSPYSLPAHVFTLAGLQKGAGGCTRA